MPRAPRAGVAVIIGLLVFGLLAVWLDVPVQGPPRFHSPGLASLEDAGSVTPLAGDRFATLWPFAKDSIWNLPIGADARFVPANITKARDWGMTVDQDVIILTPDAPRTKFFYNDDAWNGGSRCGVEGGALFEAPLPADFVVPPARPGWTPNFATAILAGDARTLIQGQPMARCTEGGDATIWWSQTREDLYGTGFSGGHGGSMLSSIGGTIRSGELVPGGRIPHAMKVNLDGSDNLYWDSATRGFRWPATAADSCASGCYQGRNPALRMGSLLALPPSIDIPSMGLETDAATIVAQAFQDFGGYVVDNTGWSVYALSTEFSPQHGWLEDEFQQAWGFPIDPSSRNNPWSRDMDRIFLALDVVDNWNKAAWTVVRESNGLLGAGGGLPRVPWAPDFGGAIPPPDLTPPKTWANVSGTIGIPDWYVTPVTVSLGATDDRSGVAAIHIRVDGGAWSGYYWPKTVAGEGSHTVEYYTTDIAGNSGPVERIEFGIDTGAPTTRPILTGTLGGDGWYRTAVTVALTATDKGSGVEGVQVRTDGGNWTAYSAPFTLSTDGLHTVEYQATDVVGNTEPASNASFLIDTQAPFVTHEVTGSLASSGWYVSPASVSIGPIGPDGSLARIEYQVDDGIWVTYTAPFVVGEGRHVIRYQAHYAQGNLGPIDSVWIDVDSTAPTVEAATFLDPIPPDAKISWTGSDAGSGILRYEISIDGSPFAPYGNLTSASGPWREGSHVLVVRAFDAAGNQGTVTIQFRVDLNAPRIIPTPPALGDHQGPVVIQVLAVAGTVGAIVGLLAYPPLRKRWGRNRPPKGTKVLPSDPSEKTPDKPPEPSSGPVEPPTGESKDSAETSAVEPTKETPPEPVKEPPEAPPEKPPEPSVSPTEPPAGDVKDSAETPPLEPANKTPPEPTKETPPEPSKELAEAPSEKPPAPVPEAPPEPSVGPAEPPAGDVKDSGETPPSEPTKEMPAEPSKELREVPPEKLLDPSLEKPEELPPPGPPAEPAPEVPPEEVQKSPSPSRPASIEYLMEAPLES
jgi:hypothetical protein